MKAKLNFPFVLILSMVLVLESEYRLEAQEQLSKQKFWPVRVYENGRFVSGLKLADFELLENGQLRKLEGLLEIHNNKDIVKQEGLIKDLPEVNRTYFLLFQMYEYFPELNEAMNFFISRALTPGDAVEVQTPIGNYHLNPWALGSTSPELVAKQMVDILKKDIDQGSIFYKSLVRDLKRFVQGIEGLNPVAGGDEQTDASTSYFGLERLLNQYRDTLIKLEAMRVVEQNKLLAFAEKLKKIKGQKVLYFVYQQEFRPELSTAMLNSLISDNQDNPHVLGNLQELFQVYARKLNLDQDKVIRAFCDAGVEVHLLFLEKVPEKLAGLTMREQSEDVFSLFSAMAKETGGQVLTGKRPLPMFEKVVEISENYYLLFYVPDNLRPQGQFINLKLNLANPRYKVFMLAGYYD